MTAGGAHMRADMAAQPDVLRSLAERREEILAGLRGPAPEGVVIVARGSSDYAAIFGRYLIEAATGTPVALAAPSLETLYDVQPRLDGWLAVGISQSGRTPEIANVLGRYARGRGADRGGDQRPREPAWPGWPPPRVDLGAGEEGAVPATKTFTAQFAAMALVAEALGDVPWGAAEWARLPDAVAEVLADPAPAERAAGRIADADGLIAVGRGYLMPVALEAALKLREAAGVRAEGWSAADFRHGPVTVARADIPTLAVSAAGPAAADVEELAARLERGGTTVLRLADVAGADLPYPGGLPEPLRALPAVVRAQQLALALALRRGLDPDEPPGLRKVTATE